MGNKDILEYIIKDCENFNKDNVRIDLETLKEVLKDLEVLEILREAYRYAIWELYNYRKEYYLQDGSDGYRKMEITKEQYDFIEQWLDQWLDGDKK